MHTFSVPYTSVVVAGPDASDRDRATAAAILASIEPTGSFGWIRSGGGHAAYVLDAWTDGETTPTFEARPVKGNVELRILQVDDSEGNVGLDSVEVPGSQPVETIDGGVASFGSVTDEVDRVELHLPGVDQPFVAKRIALPPSLNAGFDAFVFEPQPKGGPYEVVAYGTDGEVLYSSLPPLTDTVRVGTVRAFGTTWAVKLSTAADGDWGASCVEPAATSTLEPCERAWGDGSLVQTFEKPVPAVFATVGQGVEEVDVITDEGRRYPSVMIPTDGGGSIAVVALEEAGEGRFVYRWDGKVHRGRKTLRWTDVGQVIGNFSEMPG
jgi:hypothetical protein